MHSFSPEISDAKLCRREQQLSLRIDGYPELFFGPWVPPVVATQTSLNVANWHSGQFRRQRTSQGTRSVALNDHEVG
jgi:hypothetical protein